MSYYNVKQNLPHEHGSTQVLDKPLSACFIQILTKIPGERKSSNSIGNSLKQNPDLSTEEISPAL